MTRLYYGYSIISQFLLLSREVVIFLLGLDEVYPFPKGRETITREMPPSDTM
jgi:hypothetical protein